MPAPFSVDRLRATTLRTESEIAIPKPKLSDTTVCRIRLSFESLSSIPSSSLSVERPPIRLPCEDSRCIPSRFPGVLPASQINRESSRRMPYRPFRAASLSHARVWLRRIQTRASEEMHAVAPVLSRDVSAELEAAAVDEKDPVSAVVNGTIPAELSARRDDAIDAVAQRLIPPHVAAVHEAMPLPALSVARLRMN